MHLLDSVLLLLATAVVVVVVFRALKLPALIGYLIVGLLIGPHALAWLPDTAATKNLAEFGVVFLMFSIGLEFSLPKLSTMKSIVFGLGAAQVLVTILAVLGIALYLGLNWREGLALGGVLAMSSTAILAKMLAERLELNTHHGRQIIGVLLFQDLAVVPLLVILPALARGAEELPKHLLVAGMNAALLLIFILVVGQRLMRPWFHVVALRKSPELFVLNVLLCTLGLAWLTDRFGLSLALGAFLAGMLISETEYRYQVEQDIKPFQDVLLGLFFVTVGMRLDVQEIAKHWIAVPLVMIVFVAAKAAIMAVLARAFGANAATALRVGLALSAGGEFGLVLLSQAGSLALLGRGTLQVVLAAIILSMLLAPFILKRSEHLVRRFSKAEWMSRAMALHNIAAQSMGADKHIIICGYGRSGQNLARLLEQENVPFIALDADSQRVREAASAGEHVVYGDAARREVLVAAGLTRAAALVVSYADTESA
ncbi:MAG: potassium transporter, partial [Betaproteobacteria bacterium]|nr:potassium transporter [Betaproteobacteria bacterium]